jgi:hypothetical protein
MGEGSQGEGSKQPTDAPVVPNSPSLSLASGNKEMPNDNFVGSTMAAVARSALIQKLVLLPKLKAAAFFQPEDHVKLQKVHKTITPKTTAGIYWLNAFQMGAVFTAGVGMFVVHDLVLHKLAHGQDMDTAPAVKSAIAGGCGGVVYAIGATGTSNYMHFGQVAWYRSFASKFRGLRFALVRDVGGYGLYFGVYTLVRGVGIRLSSGESAWEACKGAMRTGEDNETYQDMTLSDTWSGLVEDLSWAGLGGALATTCAYCWRAPINAIYKKHYGWRSADAKVFDLKRFVTSPRGLKQVGIGTVTWMVYEAAMRGVAQLAALEQ